jgi:hypothetical protein
VLAPDDAFIPPDMEAPRRGAVPVRFFGTYNFCWIESQRSLARYSAAADDERASKSRLQVLFGPRLARSCMRSTCTHLHHPAALYGSHTLGMVSGV